MRIKNDEKETIKPKNNKYKLVLIGISVIAFLTILAISFQFLNNDHRKVVATVNGEAITARELKQYALKNKALDVSYFMNKYKTEYTKNFWTTNFKGETPIDKLKKDSLDYGIRLKVQLIMAKQNNVLKDITYDNFMKDLKQENKKKAKALKSNQVVIGAQQYSESNFYDIATSNVISSLKKVLSSAESFSDDQIKQYYEKNKESLFKNQDTLDIAQFSVSYEDKNNISVENAKKIVENVKKSLNSGISLESAVKLYGDKVKLENQLFDTKLIRQLSLANPKLLSETLKLSSGQLSNVFDENNTFYLVKCIKRNINGYITVEDAKDTIIKNLSEASYESMIKRNIKEAKVVINQKNYDSLNESLVID